MSAEEEILIEREKRVEIQQELLKKFNKPLVFIRVNYPGINKDNILTNNIIEDIDKIITNIFFHSMVLKFSRNSAEGPTIMLILDKPLEEIKKITIQIEDSHPLGRCIDIDVYDPKDGRSLSRSELGLKPRKCFLCDEMAHICVRSRKHDIKEVIQFISKCYNDYKEILNG